MAVGQRVLALLEKPLFEQVVHMAERDGISLSQKIRDLVREGIEHDEDADLLLLAMERKDRGGDLIAHDKFWGDRKRIRKRSRGR